MEDPSKRTELSLANRPPRPGTFSRGLAIPGTMGWRRDSPKSSKFCVLRPACSMHDRGELGQILLLFFVIGSGRLS